MPDIHPDNYTLDFSKWTSANYSSYVALHLDTFSANITEEALRLYPYTSGPNGPELPYTTMVTDSRLTCATDVVAQAASLAMPGLVYRYVATAFPSTPVHALGMPFPAKYAFHLSDFFAFLDAYGLYMTSSPTDSDQVFAQTTQDIIMAFAKTGHPNHSNWLPYNANIGLLSEKIKVVKSYQQKQCTFWLNNGFFDYSWRN